MPAKLVSIAALYTDILEANWRERKQIKNITCYSHRSLAMAGSVLALLCGMQVNSSSTIFPCIN